MDGLNLPSIAKKINTLIHYGVVSTRTCQRWVSSFEGGEFNVANKERTGRPCLNVNDAIQACIDEVKYATTRIIAASRNMSQFCM